MTNDKAFLGHPKGLSTLFFTEMWERFSYYGMRALLILFMVASVEKGGLGFSTKEAANIYGWYTALVYAAAIPGGWIADQFIGARRSVLYGGIFIALGHISLAFHSLQFFYMGLGLIIVGTGLLKPNISSMVGELYSEKDQRRDAGFSIFYMGINIGALLGPFICGYLRFHYDWHWGFAAAAVGMTGGIIQYLLTSKWLGDAGKKLKAKKTVTTNLAWTPGELKKIGALCILFVFSCLFWAGFEQAGSSLNLFADQLTRRVIFGYTFPAEFFQTINSMFIIALAPVFAWIWIKLDKKQPSSPSKFSLGLLFVGLGFFVIAGAAQISGPQKLSVGPEWLIAVYFLHTIGELCLSPVGLSVVTKLAPARLVGSMMGLWFLSLAVGNKLGGWVAGHFDSFPLPKLFGAVFITTASAGIILLMILKPIKRLMGDVR